MERLMNYFKDPDNHCKYCGRKKDSVNCACRTVVKKIIMCKTAGEGDLDYINNNLIYRNLLNNLIEPIVESKIDDREKCEDIIERATCYCHYCGKHNKCICNEVATRVKDRNYTSFDIIYIGNNWLDGFSILRKIGVLEYED
jgi:hypothetical protein